MKICRIKCSGFISNLPQLISKSSYQPKRFFILFRKQLSPLKLNHLLPFQIKCRSAMELSSVINLFETVVPKKLAEKWDNTGLLLETNSKLPISTVFFTNDLTEKVLEEALFVKANLIVSYHPPIFSAFKSLTSQKWKDRIIMKCIQNNIALYSPHTACDAVKGGVNDWLLGCFSMKTVVPIKTSEGETQSIINCFFQKDVSLPVLFGPHLDFMLLQKSSFEDKICCKVLVTSEFISQACRILLECPETLAVNVENCKKLECLSVTGLGRVGSLQTPMQLNECIEKVKEYLKLKHVRVAIAAEHSLDSPMSSIAVCAGSGASILRDVPADLYITGEMSHHELLDANHKRTSVILCEHSNSERGYLEHLAKDLSQKLKGVKLIISTADKDPVSIF